MSGERMSECWSSFSALQMPAFGGQADMLIALPNIRMGGCGKTTPEIGSKQFQKVGDWARGAPLRYRLRSQFYPETDVGWLSEAANQKLSGEQTVGTVRTFGE